MKIEKIQVMIDALWKQITFKANEDARTLCEHFFFRRVILINT